jgi:wobble nucleotide-excising tRNase
MQSVASFSSTSPSSFETNAQIIFIYGLNGSGKTTISRFLQNPKNPIFSQCSLDVEGNLQDYELLVYNQDFIENNFYNKENQQGVFTIGKENADAERKIETAQEAKKELILKRDQAQEKIDSLKMQRNEARTQIEESVFSEKKKHTNRDLDYCFTGYKNDKKKFFEKVLSTKYIEDIDYDENTLIKDIQELSGDTSIEKLRLTSPSLDLSDIELDTVFAEIISGSQESYLSTLINELSNSDWVKQGLAYLDVNESKCPFCQQKPPSDLKQELQKIFDQVYESTIQTLTTYKQQYENEVTILENLLKQKCFEDKYVTEDVDFVNAKNDLLNTLKSNLALIEKKLNTPSQEITLDLTKEKVLLLNKGIQQIDLKISGYNQRRQSKDATKEEIKNKLWILIRNQYNETITTWKKNNDELNSTIVQKENNLNTIKAQINNLDRVISENRAKIINIDLAIKSINSNIENLGLLGFKIDKDINNPDFYKIIRDGNQENNVYRSLSEGEKTLITFLYFLELLKGSHNKDDSINKDNRIVVVDDPISSLSQNYIYDVAYLIQEQIIQSGFGQVFILTHSLYLLHEFINLNKHKKKVDSFTYFRIRKNEYSQIVSMDKNEIQNIYQANWQIVKDFILNSELSVAVPNAMRQILDYYFSFVHKQDSLKTALNEIGIEDHSAKPFCRFLNRESHLDGINIDDFNDRDAHKYFPIFKQVFVKTGFEGHYSIMMGEMNEPNINIVQKERQLSGVN